MFVDTLSKKNIDLDGLSKENFVDPKTEKMIDNKIIAKEHSCLTQELKSELQFGQYWFDFIDDLRSDFGDLDGQELDFCLNELKKFHSITGVVLNKDFFLSLLQSVYDKKNFKKEKNQKILFSDIFNEILLDFAFEAFESDILENNFTIQDKFVFLLYCFERQRDIDQKKRNLLAKRFEQILAYYKEGKILEVYEIYIDENGNIVIKGTMNGKSVKIIFDPKTKIFIVEES